MPRHSSSKLTAVKINGRAVRLSDQNYHTMRLVTLHLTEGAMNDIEYLIELKRTPNRSEFIRSAVHEKIHREFGLLSIKNNFVQDLLNKNNGKEVTLDSNSETVLNAFRGEKKIANSELFARSGLSIYYFKNAISDLMEKGLIQIDYEKISGAPGRSRKFYSILVDVVPGA